MTVNELFTITAGVMGSTTENASSYVPTLIPQVNMILAQTFNLENNNRAYYGLDLLTTIPSVSSISDILTYQDGILRRVIPWGLAQLFALSDDDIVRSQFFETRFADAVRLESKFIAQDIEDVFAGEEE